MSSKAEPKIKHCSKCGKPFECLHSKDCWCMDYAISAENLEMLKGTFTDCLCPCCLQEYATSVKPGKKNKK